MASPLALYRRYRPATFAEVVGQPQVTAPLQRALATGRVGHAYLFSGPRGCGKTTSARILARSLNCEQGPTPTPCGVCRSCVELAPGGPGSVDVVEIDAASHGKVDDTRDLRERAFFAPVAARRKIYIIDEAHMVSKEGFNALLKVVEEPPEHLTFVFATTEPDKVLPTIRSRTHHYPFRLIAPKILTEHLSWIARQESLAIEPAALALVVRAGGGSARDALSVLDQLMAGAGAEGITYDAAVSLLGYTPESLLDRVVDALAATDGAEVFAAVGQVVDGGQDPRRFAEDLLRRLRDLVVLGAVPGAGAAVLLDVPPETVERLVAQLARFGQAQALRAAELVDAGLTEIRGATAPRLHLELLLARLLLPAADATEAGFAARIERIERRLAAPVVAAVAVPEPGGWAADDRAPVEDPRAADPGSSGTAADARDDQRVPGPDDSPAVEPAPDPGPAVPTGSKPPAPVTPSGAPGPGSLGVPDLRKLWDDVLDDVKSRSRIAHAALVGSQVVGVDAGRLTVSFANEGMRTNFTKGNRAPVLHAALHSLLALDVVVDTVVGAGTTPMAAESAAPQGSPGAQGSPGPQGSQGVAGAPSVYAERNPGGGAARTVGAPVRGPEGGSDGSRGNPRDAVSRRGDGAAAGRAHAASPDADSWPVAAVPGGPDAAPVQAPRAPAGEADDIGPDDPDLDDPGVSGRELLVRELGAEVIAERPAG